MLQRTKTIRKESVFLAIYSMFLVLSIIRLSFFARYFSTITNIYNYFCLLFLALYEIVLNRTITLRSLVELIFFALISVIICVKTPSFFAIMLIIAFMFVGRNINFDVIAKTTYIADFICLITIVASSYLGGIVNYVSDSGRKYMGFLYALYAPAILFNCVTNYIYSHRDLIKWKSLLLFAIINWFFFTETRSRLSSCFTFAIIIIACFMVHNKKFLKKSGKILSVFIPIYIICAIASIYIVVEYRSNIVWMNGLNQVLGHRISYAQTSLLRYGISLLGSPVEWNGAGLNIFGQVTPITEYLYVDNLYMRILQQYGIIFLILYIGLHTIVLAKCYQKKEYLLMIIFIVLAFHGLIDDLTLHLHSNSFWLAIGSFVLSDKFSKASNRYYAISSEF